MLLHKFIPTDNVYSIGKKVLLIGEKTPLANYTKRGKNLCYWYAIYQNGDWFFFDIRVLPQFNLVEYEELLSQYREDVLLEFVKNQLEIRESLTFL